MARARIHNSPDRARDVDPARHRPCGARALVVAGVVVVVVVGLVVVVEHGDQSGWATYPQVTEAPQRDPGERGAGSSMAPAGSLARSDPSCERTCAAEFCGKNGPHSTPRGAGHVRYQGTRTSSAQRKAVDHP